MQSCTIARRLAAQLHRCAAIRVQARWLTTSSGCLSINAKHVPEAIQNTRTSCLVHRTYLSKSAFMQLSAATASQLKVPTRSKKTLTWQDQTLLEVPKADIFSALQCTAWRTQDGLYRLVRTCKARKTVKAVCCACCRLPYCIHTSSAWLDARCSCHGNALYLS